MHSIVITVAIILLLLTAGWLSFKAQSQGHGVRGKRVTVQKIGKLSQTRINEMLEKLETTQAPEPRMGAMCYDMAGPPNRVEYVCPVCGEKTLYTEQKAFLIGAELESCRRLNKTLSKLAKDAMSEEEALAHYRRVRDEIRNYIMDATDHGERTDSPA